MRSKLRSAVAAGQNDPVKSPNPWLSSLLLSASALALICAATSSALAQTPPTPDPRQYGLTLIGAPTAWAAGYSGAGVTIAVGDTGIALTPLRPAGTARIGERRVDVVAEGEFVERDAGIIVIACEGARIVVRKKA